MRIGFTARPDLEAPAVVVGLWKGGRPTPAFTALDARGALSRAVSAARFAGDEGKSLTVMAPAGTAAGRVLVVGLGAADGMGPPRAERVGGQIAAELQFSGCDRATVALDLPGLLPAHVALGIRLRAWHPPLVLRGRVKDDELPSLTDVALAAADVDAARHAFFDLDQVAEGVKLARDLTVEPANLLTPQNFVTRASLLAEVGADVEVMDEVMLEGRGLRLLAAVGRGSAHPPRLVTVKWSGAGGRDAPLVFVGKGITFDTGGISIKHGDKVHEMKGDMAGAAAALGALRALAGRRAPVNAVAVMALAENMPSGRAMRPGDVIRSHSGRSVEVVDTDAEGRLVLADALSWACDTFRPRSLVDLATLTGAMVTTLGRHRAGLFANDDDLAARLIAAGEAVDEPLWRLPLSAAHDEALKSDLADVRNAAWGRLVPDALHAARFLQGFVREGVPWAHLDIAGVAETSEDGPLCPKGPTGFGVRLLDRMADAD